MTNEKIHDLHVLIGKIEEKLKEVDRTLLWFRQERDNALESIYESRKEIRGLYKRIHELEIKYLALTA